MRGKLAELPEADQRHLVARRRLPTMGGRLKRLVGRVAAVVRGYRNVQRLDA